MKARRANAKATSPAPLFVDTWGWLALEDRADAAHKAVVALRQDYAARNVPWLTTDYILDETFTRLFRRRPFGEAARFAEALWKARDAGALIVEPVTPERFEAAFRLRLKLRDKPRVSFTDITSFIVMKELRLSRVLTGDAHFSQVSFGFQVAP